MVRHKHSYKFLGRGHGKLVFGCRACYNVISVTDNSWFFITRGYWFIPTLKNEGQRYRRRVTRSWKLW